MFPFSWQFPSSLSAALGFLSSLRTVVFSAWCNDLWKQSKGLYIKLCCFFPLLWTQSLIALLSPSPFFFFFSSSSPGFLLLKTLLLFTEVANVFQKNLKSGLMPLMPHSLNAPDQCYRVSDLQYLSLLPQAAALCLLTFCCMLESVTKQVQDPS